MQAMTFGAPTATTARAQATATQPGPAKQAAEQAARGAQPAYQADQLALSGAGAGAKADESAGARRRGGLIGRLMPAPGPRPCPAPQPRPVGTPPAAPPVSEGAAPALPTIAPALDAKAADALHADYRAIANEGRRDLDLTHANGFTEDKQAPFKAAIAKHAAAEQAVLTQLTPGQQQAYADVKAVVASDPPAQAALMGLLAEGKLTGGPAAKDGTTLLDNLAGMARGPLAEGLDRTKLVADTVQELFEPSCIAQHNRGTCGAASVQIKLAGEQPAEYARVVGGLASPEGKVQLRGGETLAREEGTLKPDDTPRTLSSRLMQPAFMELGDPDHDYSNKDDMQHAPDGKKEGGLRYTSIAHLTGQLTGTPHHVPEAVGPAEIKAMQAEFAAGRGVPIGMRWSASGLHTNHAVLATGIQDGTLFYRNPWGLEGRMPLQRFLDRNPTVILPVQP